LIHGLAIVAQRFGFDKDEALTLGKTVADLNGKAKGQRLGFLFDTDKFDSAKATKAMRKGLPDWRRTM
jgi:hypothetical protein